MKQDLRDKFGEAINLHKDNCECSNCMKLKQNINVGAICIPMCLKHDAPRPCPICDKEWYEKEVKNEHHTS